VNEGEERLARPQPKTTYRVLIRNRRALADWERLLRARLEVCIRCWDHLASTPTQPIGSRYVPLKGDMAWCEFRGQRLRQWQYEIDSGARVKVAVGKDTVIIMSVSTGHSERE
jgi:hypothetical protein